MTEKKRRTRANIPEIWLMQQDARQEPMVAFLNEQDAQQVTQEGKDLFGVETTLTKVKVWKPK